MAMKITKAPIYEAKFPNNEILGFVKIPFFIVESNNVSFSLEKEAMAMQYIMAKKFKQLTNISREGSRYVCRLITNDVQFEKCEKDLISVSSIKLFEVIEVF